MRLMVIVIERDGDLLTAQCDPYDICTQGRNLDELLYRLRMQIGEEIRVAGSLDKVPRLPTHEDVLGILADKPAAPPEGKAG